MCPWSFAPHSLSPSTRLCYWGEKSLLICFFCSDCRISVQAMKEGTPISGLISSARGGNVFTLSPPECNHWTLTVQYYACTVQSHSCTVFSSIYYIHTLHSTYQLLPFTATALLCLKRESTSYFCVSPGLVLFPRSFLFIQRRAQNYCISSGTALICRALVFASLYSVLSLYDGYLLCAL